ncbi:MAG: M48 family peptidase, partial [Actinomycetes bacterium]
MTSRTALVATAVVLAVALVVLVALLTPWKPLSLHGAEAVPTDPARDFTAAQLAREDAYHGAVRPPSYVSLGLSLLIACLLGFTAVGARIVERVASPFGGGWGWQVLLGAVALTLLGRLLVLPWDAWSESVRREYGLSTRTCGGWAVDVAKSYGVGLVLTLVVLFLVVGLARWSPQWWWTVGAALAAALVVVVSFAYPVVVEPVFNKFTPMPSGELRSSLLALARADGVAVEDVLVADASRRT